jgi:hypothetical protein
MSERKHKKQASNESSTDAAIDRVISHTKDSIRSRADIKTIQANGDLSVVDYQFFSNNRFTSNVVGDVFRDINNATIINRSSVEKSFNKVKWEYDEETSKALIKVAEFIENSKDPAAGALFNNSTEELSKPQPDKSMLKSFWSAIEKVLPAITTIAGTVTKIAPLLT